MNLSDMLVMRMSLWVGVLHIAIVRIPRMMATGRGSFNLDKNFFFSDGIP